MKEPPTEAALLWNPEIYCSPLSYLFRVVNAARVDLDNLSRDDLAKRVVAVNQAQRFQRERKGAVESLDLSRVQLPIPKQPIDPLAKGNTNARPLESSVP